ncbi:MAG: putative DNA binding protein [uncultured archaeon A07HR67]|jgi:Predicted DNA binding protein|nr:MAG: putative DNA binding protein [uncultured archaeon A07HR67]
MISARFRIRLPEHLWVSELSRQFSTAEFTLLSGFRVGSRALELGEVATGAPDSVVEAMRTHPEITSCDVLESDPERVLTKYETPQTDLYDFAETSALTIEFPVEVRDGWYWFDLTGTRAEFDELRATLDAMPRPYELESLVTRTDTDSLLTDRQREVLRAAVREGYFTVPRECTLAELADSIGVDKSSASETLRRAEARLVKWFLSGPESSQ